MAEVQWKAALVVPCLPVLHPAHSSADTSVPPALPVCNSPDSRQALQKQPRREGLTGSSCYSTCFPLAATLLYESQLVCLCLGQK